MKSSIPVTVRVQDNGDGGYSVYAYNSDAEMLADHYGYTEVRDEHGEDSDEARERAREILDGDDEYQDGYVSHDTIEVEVVDGVAKLAEPIHFHAGQ